MLWVFCPGLDSVCSAEENLGHMDLGFHLFLPLLSHASPNTTSRDLLSLQRSSMFCLLQGLLPASVLGSYPSWSHRLVIPRSLL